MILRLIKELNKPVRDHFEAKFEISDVRYRAVYSYLKASKRTDFLAAEGKFDITMPLAPSGRVAINPWYLLFVCAKRFETPPQTAELFHNCPRSVPCSELLAIGCRDCAIRAFNYLKRVVKSTEQCPPGCKAEGCAECRFLKWAFEDAKQNVYS